jgi:hypothetical protein
MIYAYIYVHIFLYINISMLIDYFLYIIHSFIILVIYLIIIVLTLLIGFRIVRFSEITYSWIRKNSFYKYDPKTITSICTLQGTTRSFIKGQCWSRRNTRRLRYIYVYVYVGIDVYMYIYVYRHRRRCVRISIFLYTYMVVLLDHLLKASTEVGEIQGGSGIYKYL